MAASPIQKCAQLSRRFGLAALVLQAGCASSLKGDGDFKGPPPDLSQKIEVYDPKKSPSVTAAASVSTPAPVDKKSKSVKKNKKAVVVKEESVAARSKVPTWTPKAWPFGVGERIRFLVRYGVLEGGVGTLEVMEPKVVDGTPVLHYRALAKSSKLLEAFYRIDDEVQSWIRLSDHMPIRHEIRQNESGKWGSRVVVFDHDKKISKFYSNTTHKDGRHDEIRQDVNLNHWSQDVMGAMYFYRFVDNLKNLNFPVYDRFSNWNNEFTYVGKEKIRVPAGEFDAIKIKMNPRVDGDLKTRGDLLVWFKDDDSKILLQFKAKIRIGSVTGELLDYKAGTPIDLPLPQMKTPTNLNSMGQVQR